VSLRACELNSSFVVYRKSAETVASTSDASLRATFKACEGIACLSTPTFCQRTVTTIQSIRLGGFGLGGGFEPGGGGGGLGRGGPSSIPPGT